MRLPFPCLLPALLALIAGPAPATNTQVATDKPIINFRLPAFTPDGHRSWLVRGSEASVASQDLINIRELTLSIFSLRQDDRVETMILSPEARVQPAESLISGDQTIRVINDEFEASGSVWRYVHKDRRVMIDKNVRVVFNTELKEFLK